MARAEGEARLGMVAAPNQQYPRFPQHYVPSLHILAEAFLKDFQAHEKLLLRELRMMVSTTTLAIDYQWQVRKKAKGTDVLGKSGLTMTVMGDHNLVLGVYCVPSTSGKWIGPAIEEIVRHHN